MINALLFVVFVAAGVLISLLLGGCAEFEERPLKVGTEYKAIALNRTYAAKRECTKEAITPPNWTAIACAYPNREVCEIKVMPDASDDTLGHELRHCFDGRWHR